MIHNTMETSTEQEHPIEKPQSTAQVRKRTKRSGSIAMQNVRKQMKSTEPIFYHTVVSALIKDNAPPGTRVTPAAVQLVGTILQNTAIEFSKNTYCVSKFLRGDGTVRAMKKDSDLALRLTDGQKEDGNDFFGELIESLEKKNKKHKKLDKDV